MIRAIRSRYQRVILFSVLLPLLSLSRLTAGAAPNADSVVTVIIVRHAEKADPDAEDPQLSEAGGRRAVLLSSMAAESGISAIYATQFVRTQQTVARLAKQLSVQVRQSDSENVPELAAKILADHRGDTVLVAGHTNTVPQLIELLTGQTVQPIDETDYSNLFVVVSWGARQGKLVRLRYGASGADSPSAAR